MYAQQTFIPGCAISPPLDKNRKGEPLKKRTLQHIKAFLSGVFKLAKNHGYVNGENPVRDSTVPPAPEGAETYAYSVEEKKKHAGCSARTCPHDGCDRCIYWIAAKRVARVGLGGITGTGTRAYYKVS